MLILVYLVGNKLLIVEHNFLLARLTGRVGVSGWVAALFAVHPLQVDPVAWITARKDVLNGFFGLLALHAYVDHVKRPGFLRAIPVAVLFACSLMAKPALVTFPLLLLLIDYWPVNTFVATSVFVRENCDHKYISN